MTISYQSGVTGYYFLTDAVDEMGFVISMNQTSGPTPDEDTLDAAIKAFADIVNPVVPIAKITKVLTAWGSDDWLYIPS